MHNFSQIIDERKLSLMILSSSKFVKPIHTKKLTRLKNHIIPTELIPFSFHNSSNKCRTINIPITFGKTKGKIQINYNVQTQKDQNVIETAV
jgi:hypothetical protein